MKFKLSGEYELTYLALADLEGEGLSPVPGGVDLLAVGEGQRVVAGHLVTLGRESGAIALLHSLDVHAHGDAQDEELGVGVEKREPGDASVEGNKDKQAKPDLSVLPV